MTCRASENWNSAENTISEAAMAITAGSGEYIAAICSRSNNIRLAETQA